MAAGEVAAGARGRRGYARRGYSFPEVLFAVIVLGIGFIMIASVFPVAIQQSKMSADETVATTAARAGAAVATALGGQTATGAGGAPIKFNMLPVTGTTADPSGQVMPIATEAAWRMLRGNLVFNRDPRYGYVLLYRRNGIPGATNSRTWASSAQIYVITVQCRSSLRPADTPDQARKVTINGVAAGVPPRLEQEFDAFDYAVDVDASTTPITNTNNLAPRRVSVKELTDDLNGEGVDVITLETDTSKLKVAEPGQNLPWAATEGAFIIRAGPGPYAGQIYRLGAERSAGVFELIPGADCQTNAEDIASGSNEDFFVVGREWIAPYGVEPANFVGPAQDISIFTTFVPVSQ